MTTLLIGVALVSVGLFLNYALPIAKKELEIRRLRRRCREARALVLTFDDGPSAATPKVLDLLAEYGARATFFVPADCARFEVPLLKEIQNRGHEIGSHSNSHLHAWKVWPWSVHRDALLGWSALKGLGASPSLYRPAFGKITATTWLGLWRAGAQLAWWTIDSSDTKKVLDPGRAQRELRAAGGGVVLMHDSVRSPAHAAFVLDTTRSLLEQARDESFNVVPMGDLLGLGSTRTER